MTAPTTAPAVPSFAIADAELPPITRGSETAGPNPFSEVLAQSKEQGKGKQVKVPAAQVGTVIRYIRRAANDQNIGSRIVLRDGKGNTLDTKTVGGTKTPKGRTSGGRLAVMVGEGDNAREYKGEVTVLFQGQKRKTAPKKDTATDAPATDATPAPAPTA